MKTKHMRLLARDEKNRPYVRECKVYSSTQDWAYRTRKSKGKVMELTFNDMSALLLLRNTIDTIIADYDMNLRNDSKAQERGYGS